MRILALRGENLASLAEPFALDFEAEPLRGAGIIAITGPTGAGKSTLLDAICLALFDRVPRLAGADRDASSGREGEADSLAQNDVRALLRHGATRAFAELAFVGRDGEHYVSRWEVRRAHGRADGRLQASNVVLRAGGRILGDKKTDTLARIETAIGLNFEQFRRAVLLAQGEFDAFLRAASKDRAELLERITGATIYSALSRAAYERAINEMRAITELRARAGEHRPLDDAVRVSLDAAHHAANSGLASLGRERDALQARAAWREAHARLLMEIAAAAASAADARDRAAAAEPQRVRLATMRRAIALRPGLDTLVSMEARHQRATERRQQSDAVASVAASAFAAARMAARLAETEARVSAVQAVRLLGASLAATRERERVARDWLESHAPYARVAEREADLLADIAAHGDCLDDLRGYAIDDIAGARDNAIATQSRLRAEIATFDRDAIEASRRALEVAASRMRDAHRFASAASAAAIEAGEAAGSLAMQTSRAEAAAARAASLAGTIAAEQARIDAVEHALAWLDAAASEAASTLRATLVDGEPCPVCGAANHDGLDPEETLRRRRVEDRATLATRRRALDAMREDAGSESAIAREAGEAAQACVALLARKQEAARVATVSGTDALAAAAACLREVGLAPDADVATAREAIDARLDEFAKAQSEAAKIANALREMDAASRAQEEAASLAGRIAALIGAIHGGWREDGALASWCEARAAEWRRCQGEQTTLAERTSALAAALAAADARVAGLPVPAMEMGATEIGVTAPSDEAVAVLRARLDAVVGRALAVHASAAETFRAAERDDGDKCAAAEAARRDERETGAELAGPSVAFARALAANLVARAEVAAATTEAEAALVASIDAIDRALRDAATILAERERRAGEHATSAPAEAALDPGDALAAIAPRIETAEAERRRLDRARAADDEARASLTGIRDELASREAQARIWQQLNELIGSESGTKFRRFAQSVTLDQLIGLANLQLRELAPRYELQRAPVGDLALQVIDRDLADEVRGLANLSGGERFLISLALSLGLAELSSGKGVRVQSLFIDEGFGALDRDSLAQAISVLEQLQATGRQIAVISHIDEVKERILVKIAVTPSGGGKSRVAVVIE